MAFGLFNVSLAAGEPSENNIFWIPPKLPHPISLSPPLPSTHTPHQAWSWAVCLSVWALCNNEHAVNTHFDQPSDCHPASRGHFFYKTRDFTRLLVLSGTVMWSSASVSGCYYSWQSQKGVGTAASHLQGWKICNLVTPLELKWSLDGSVSQPTKRKRMIKVAVLIIY